MLLERLILENYGIYGGRTEFELSCTPEKPIILVGGVNGAGKSTIFEAILVALYGKSHLGRKTTKKEYTQFIIDRIHNTAGKKGKTGAVEITFRFYHDGKEYLYTVRREWRLEGASISESLHLFRNNRLVDDINESQWQTFIEGLVPLEITKLFFFDGEKIAKITKWSNKNNNEIQTSLDILLGTEIVNRLDSDLELYMVRRSGLNGKTDDGMVKDSYNEMMQEKNHLVNDITTLGIERDRKNEEIIENTETIGRLESKVSSMGGGYADIRNELLTQKAVFEEKSKQQKKIIFDVLSGDAPLYLVPSILDDIKKKIEEDTIITQNKAAEPLLEEYVNQLKKDIRKKEFWPDGSNHTALYKKVSKKISVLLEKKPKEKNTLFFDMSPNDSEWMKQKIRHLQDEHSNISQTLQEYGKTQQHLKKVDTDLENIPSDDEIGPRIHDINKHYENVGVLKTELAHLDQKISSKQAHLKILQNKLRNLIITLNKDERTEKGVELAARMRQALDTFKVKLKERKIKQLETHLLDAMKILLHKDMIGRININRDTLEIKVYGKNDELISGGLLSMGESQIIGTALLWALAKTSGRSLPFVIDTPLSRLDRKHLANLLEHFYPFVSHQLIILSTDREIGHKEYRFLHKYITRSYRIELDDEKLSNSTIPGYFMMEKEIA